jgi:hypothetical protein
MTLPKVPRTEVANTITDRMIRKHEVRKMTTRIHDVRHEDMVEVLSAMEALIQLYKESGSYDADKSFNARMVQADAMNEYNVSQAEIDEHELCKQL